MSISQVATLTADVVVNTANMDKTLASMKASLEKTHQALQQFVNQGAAGSRVLNQTTQSLQKTRQEVEQFTTRTRSLQQTLRDMTVGLAGNNVAALALGNTLGAIVAAGILSAVAAVGQAVRQFGELHNELTLVAGVSARAGQSMQVITDVAKTSSSSIRELQQRYTALVQTYQGSRTTIEEINAAFRKQEEALSAIRENTVGGAMNKFLDSLGGAVMEFDKLHGVSNLFVGALRVGQVVIEAIAAVARFLQNPFGRNQEISARVQVLHGVRELQNEIAIIEQELETIDRNRNTLGGARLLTLRSEEQLRRDAVEASRKLALAQADAALAEERAAPITARIREELQQQVSLMRATQVQQEIQNRLLQIEVQLRQAGLNAEQAKAQAQALAGQVTAATYANQFQSLRDSLLSQEALEIQSFQRRTEMLTQFHQLGLIQRQEFDALYEAEFARSQARMVAIQAAGGQMVFQAQSAALNEAVNLLGVFSAKNKGAALAALAIQKGLAIAQVAINIPIMQARAISELGVIAGTPVAAAIQAWGAVQIGLIAATGLAQAAQIARGTPTGGGGGGGAPSLPSAPEGGGSMPTRIVIEPVDPNMIFTGEQLNRLIEQMNEKTSNGNVLIASRLL